MDNSLNVNDIRQKVMRESRQDGIVEIWLGIFFLYYAVFFDNFARGLPTQSAMVVFFILIAGFPFLQFKLIRNVFTYPRMGYVNVKMKIPTAPMLVFVLPVAALPLITYVAVRWLSDLVDLGLMLRLMSVLFGIAFGALYFGFARSFGLAVYRFLAGLSVISGTILSFIQTDPPGVTIFLVLQAIFLLSYGVFMLIRFIRKYPKPRPEPGHTNDLEIGKSSRAGHDE